MDTFGKRTKYARLESGLSQPALARKISEITRSNVSKALVSQWETDRVAKPNGSNLFGLERATGFRVKWLLTGELPMRVSEPADDDTGSTGGGIDRVALEKAIAAVFHDVPNVRQRARAVAGIYMAMQHDPSTNPATLARLAESLLPG